MSGPATDPPAVVPPSVRVRRNGVPPLAALRAITRIGLRAAKAFFTDTIPVPGPLDPRDPGPCATSVCWAGQATCLIGLGGHWFLTDPNLSPVIGRFVRRIVQAGFAPDDLPPLAAAVVSHAHMDHMDMPTLRALPGRPRLFAAPGGSRYLGGVRRSGRFAEVRDLAHWETVDLGGATITAVSAVHDGWRWGVESALVDASASGFVFRSAEATVYYAGDTAYDERLFVEIGRRFDIDVLICPVGPLEPRWLMKWFHADPADALRIFADTGALSMLPVHHNTFVQSWEGSTEAIAEFVRLRADHSRGSDAFILRPGDQAVYRAGEGGVELAEVRSPYPDGYDDPRVPGDAPPHRR